MTIITEEWKSEIKRHKNLILISCLFLIIAIGFDYLSGIYVEKTIGVSATDLILDHIPTLDLDIIFIYGAVIIFAAFFIYPLLFKVRELHIVIGQFSLLYLIRSAFVIFTHLQTPIGALKFHIPYILSFLTFQNDLFFSGHVALPFLGFLIFRKEKIGWFFLAATIIMAFTVLFMHVHYSIDVFAALFIAYGSYKIGEWFFRKINHY